MMHGIVLGFPLLKKKKKKKSEYSCNINYYILVPRPFGENKHHNNNTIELAPTECMHI